MAREYNIEGMADLIRRLDALPTQIAKNALKKAIRKAGNIMRDAMKARCRVRTGKLRDSIKVRIPKAPDDKVFTAYVGPGAFYAHMLEFGTKKMSAKPFVRPVFDEQADMVVKVVAAEASKEVIRLAKKGG